MLYTFYYNIIYLMVKLAPNDKYITVIMVNKFMAYYFMVHLAQNCTHTVYSTVYT
jgi:hypothetical protein